MGTLHCAGLMVWISCVYWFCCFVGFASACCFRTYCFIVLVLVLLRFLMFGDFVKVRLFVVCLNWFWFWIGVVDLVSLNWFC